MIKQIIKQYWYNTLICLIILLGIILRFKGYWDNPSFWHDECALAWNVKFKTYSEFFTTLRFMQIAPPLFMIATKFLTFFLGYSEKVFRLIPFIASCLSINIFYFLAKKALNKKQSVLIAVFLFAINAQLINYSFEFKPYETDAFLTIILLLFFLNYNPKNSSNLKTLLFGSLLAILPWFSFVSTFVLLGGFANILFKNIKDNLVKKINLIFPFIISMLIYLSFYSNNNNKIKLFNYWEQYFITLNPLKFLYLIAESIRYLFFPSQAILFAFILIGIGIFAYLREKSALFLITSTSLLCLFIASYFHFYPFADRLIIFLIPIYILFVTKSLDTLSNKQKLKSIIILILTVVLFLPQILLTKYMLITPQKINKGEFPREMIVILKNNLQPKDLIYVSKLSNTEYIYYSSFFNIKNTVIQEPQSGERISHLNQIPKHNYCWFYIPYDNYHNNILNWIKVNGIIIKKNVLTFNDKLIYAYIK